MPRTGLFINPEIRGTILNETQKNILSRVVSKVLRPDSRTFNANAITLGRFEGANSAFWKNRKGAYIALVQHRSMGVILPDDLWLQFIWTHAQFLGGVENFKWSETDHNNEARPEYVASEALLVDSNIDRWRAYNPGHASREQALRATSDKLRLAETAPRIIQQSTVRAHGISSKALKSFFNELYWKP